MRQHRRFQLPNSTNSTQTERFLRANAANSMQYKKFQRQNAANSMQHGRFSSKMLQITRKMKGSSSKMLQIACTWKGNGRIDAGDGKQNRSGKKIPGAGEKNPARFGTCCEGQPEDQLRVMVDLLGDVSERAVTVEEVTASHAHAHVGLACTRACWSRVCTRSTCTPIFSRAGPRNDVSASTYGHCPGFFWRLACARCRLSAWELADVTNQARLCMHSACL